MNIQLIAKIMIVAGIILLLTGIILFFFHNKLGWLGHLPGDIRIERENFRFYFPFTTLIIISLLLNVIWRLINKFF